MKNKPWIKEEENNILEWFLKERIRLFDKFNTEKYKKKNNETNKLTKSKK